MTSVTDLLTPTAITLRRIMDETLWIEDFSVEYDAINGEEIETSEAAESDDTLQLNVNIDSSANRISAVGTVQVIISDVSYSLKSKGSFCLS